MKLKKAHFRIISVVLIGVVVLQIFQHNIGIKIDSTTVTLLGLAILLFILPELPNLTKLKYGDVELEFEKDVNRIEKMVVAEEVAEESKTETARTSQKIDWQHYYNEYREIMGSGSSNIEKILRASQLVELMIVEAGKDFEINARSPRQVMTELSNHELITREELDLYNEFQTLRNKVIHGEIKEISDSLATRVLDILWRIVRIFG